ncbi:MAG TPA: ABC transporter substrate-binding protein, partial [Myxococcales bacterium]|nr:ABC transporter substrate-binding protein [Myxococcales bacterium]
MVFLVVALLAVPATHAVGIVLPLSGPRQQRGQMLLHSIQMKADEINGAGGIDGRRIELIVRDTGNQPELSRKAATELAADPRVLAVIGHYDNEAAAAAVPIYDQNRIPVFLPSIGNKDSFANSTWAFSGTYDDASEAQIMAVFIKLIRHHEEVLVFHTSDIYEDLWAAFQHKAELIGLKARGIVFASQITGAVAADFVAKNVPSLPAGVQAIVVLGQSANGGALIRQLRERGIKVPIYGNSRVSAGELFEVIGPHTQDLHAAFPFMFDTGSDKALEFRREYVRRYNSEPSAFGIFAYDGLGMIAEGIRVKGASRAAIRDYLASLDSPTRAYDGASGISYF